MAPTISRDDWVLVGAGAAAGAVITVAALHLQHFRAIGGLCKPAAAKDVEERSTTSSVGGGAAAYETRKAVDEYLQFHFGTNADILPYEAGPRNALNFTARLAQLCSRFVPAGQPGRSALDVGCAVGGASFELARSFERVVGIDYSQAFVDAARDMAATGHREYEAALEGDIRGRYVAAVPASIRRNRVEFMQGDACALPASLGSFDAVLAANLLCRLPDPLRFIDRLPSLVKPGGVVVLVSPYSWLPAWTPKDKWLGGRQEKGERSAAVLTRLMTARGFELVHAEDMPFLIREHARKFQWGCSHACVWRRRP